MRSFQKQPFVIDDKMQDLKSDKSSREIYIYIYINLRHITLEWPAFTTGDNGHTSCLKIHRNLKDSILYITSVPLFSFNKQKTECMGKTQMFARDCKVQTDALK